MGLKANATFIMCKKPITGVSSFAEKFVIVIVVENLQGKYDAFIGFATCVSYDHEYKELEI